MNRPNKTFLVGIATLILSTTSPEVSAEVVKPRILILFDSSGSMTLTMDGDPTGGDGSADPLSSGRFCCPGVGNSRLHIAKEAMTQMLDAAGDIEFALMKFPQTYDASQANAIVAEWYAYNQVLGEYDKLRYHGISGTWDIGLDKYDYTGAFNDDRTYLIEKFVPGNSAEIKAWMDHREYDADLLPLDESKFEGPYGDRTEQELRADGATPLGEAVDAAYDYLSAVKGTDLKSDCRPYYLIVLADGDFDGMIDPVTGEHQGGGEAQNSVNQLHDVLGIDTWVIGLATSNDTLNNMADVGGCHYDPLLGTGRTAHAEAPDCPGGTNAGYAFEADSKKALTNILYHIISSSILTEKCDGLDNDCDGETDEGFALYCDWDGEGSKPEATLCNDPGESLCDGQDNNCDGETDEGIWAPGEICGGGPNNESPAICQLGNEECIPGVGWVCVGGVSPETEVCNGYDDDCDGLIDEGDSGEAYSITGGSCGTDLGNCDFGILRCGESGWWCDGDQGSEEQCNGLQEDEDCDGLTDESFPEAGGECYDMPDTGCSVEGDTYSCKGSCRTGVWTCNESGVLECSGDFGAAAGDEICDGIDEDCDGLTDEDVSGTNNPTLGTACPANIAALNLTGSPCQAGTITCEGASGLVCTGTVVGPTAEVCDGINNDCDAETDEGLWGPCGGCTDVGCGDPDEGECRVGIGACDPTASTPGNPDYSVGCNDQGPVAEICNGGDDDCDGLTDENDSDEAMIAGEGTCGQCNDGQWFCHLGSVVCCLSYDIDTHTCTEPPPPGPDLCDGQSFDDCNLDTPDGMDEDGFGDACDSPLDDDLCADGKLVCAGGPGLVCDDDASPDLGEVCDGEDNDCDGLTDEDPSGAPLMAGEGSCGTCGDGLWYCDRGGASCCAAYDLDTGECTAPATPEPDDCDGNTLDDCNEDTPDGVDEPWYGQPCDGPDSDACNEGVYDCVGSAQVCTDTTGDSRESCDGLDNDCDGTTDEDLAYGVCGVCHDGVNACVDGTWECCEKSTYVEFTTCETTQVPEPETCNNMDDNCNGLTDEFLTRSCRSDGQTYEDGAGICHLGTQSCREGNWGYGEDTESWQAGVCGNEQIPMDEVCDCLDNDCDGLTDETEAEDKNTTDGGNGTDWINYMAETGETDDLCGYGDCGRYFCDPGRCDYSCSGHSQPEICNGMDDNCNGEVDEGLFRRCGGCDAALYPPEEHPVEDCLAAIEAEAGVGPDEGECRLGVSWCEAEIGSGVAAWGECQGSIGPKNELCDGKDNDCDGVTDENEEIEQVGDQCQSAEGRCEAGWWQCVDDGQGVKSIECCAAVTGTNECVSPAGPALEECNALDDDCDGDTDEEEDLLSVGEACATDVGICESGAYRCVCENNVCEVVCLGAKGPQTEVCNALDDDCDGLTDEDLPLGATCTESPTGEAVGECDMGYEECIDGKWQCNSNSPTGEKCDGLDNDCDGLTDENLEVDCPGSSICIQGECQDLCVGEEMSCPAGRTCEWVKDKDGEKTQVCVSDVCNEGSLEALPCVTNSYWCDEGQSPPCHCDAAQGKCVGMCSDVSCPEGKVCVPRDGSCQVIGEDCWATGCPEKEICVKGECAADPCAEVSCEENKYCNLGGECVSPCVDLDCPAGCLEGACVDDKCAGADCPLGWECDSEDGVCKKGGPCRNVVCKFYEICVDGECVEDPCWNIECPNGLKCIDGACYAVVSASSDTDTDAEVDTAADSDLDSDRDTEVGPDTSTSGPVTPDDIGPEKLRRVLATGTGGCLCTTAVGTAGSQGANALWWGLLLVLMRLFLRQAERRYVVVCAIVMGSMVLGCDVEPYDFGLTSGTDDTSSAPSSEGDPDSSGGSDSTTSSGGDLDTDVDSDTAHCEPDEPDKDCDGVDDDCDGETDEDVDLSSNPNHCGKCGEACAYPNAFGLCIGGKCQMGDCSAFWWNENNSDHDGCEYFCEPKGVEDRCNGIDLGDGMYVGVDDDCDGETDEDVEFQSSATNCGRCGNVCRFQQAEAICVAGKCTWENCKENFANVDGNKENGCEYQCPDEVTAEICNRIDDNCDGDIDEGNPGGGEECYTAERGCIEAPGGYECKGICKAGVLQCVNGTLQCLGQRSPDVLEQCNNLDDDCDGETDEDLFQVCQTLTGDDVDKYGAGLCSRGAQTCVQGKWGAVVDGTWQAGACGGEILPSIETCNGADDDCDGATDEDALLPDVAPDDNLEPGQCSHVPGADETGKPMDPSTGACEPGLYSCVNGNWECLGGVMPQIENCDGVDNDCDGKTDENITKACGGCAADAIDLGYPAEDCLARLAAGQINSTEEGLCEQGVRKCVGSDTWGPCIATTYPQEEQCDGLDNDCDGLTDENVSRACGGAPGDEPAVGQCHAGTMVCESTATGPEWSSCQGAQGPVAETCDGLDQDCDGLEDDAEDIYRACGGCDAALYPEFSCLLGYEPAGTLCRRGRQVCTAREGSGEQWAACVGDVPPTAEKCDNLDNDCDGLTDEDEAGIPLTGAVGGKATCGQCGDGAWYCVGGFLQCCGNTYTFGGSCDPPIDASTLSDMCNGDTLDDCTATTPDGRDEPGYGSACDGAADDDLCEDGRLICSGGPGLICNDDDTTDRSEVCDGRDNDCDGTTDEDGSGDPLIAKAGACGACGDGQWFCDRGSAKCCSAYDIETGTCTPVATPGPDLCNGDTTDDCSAETPDGRDEPNYLTPCDGEDQGQCEEGYWECNGSAMFCNDLTGDDIENTCDGIDNDCDGNTDSDDDDLAAYKPTVADLIAAGSCDACPGTTEVVCDGTGGWRCKYDEAAGVECADADCYTHNAFESICDSTDGDCDGVADDDFHLLTNVNRCGGCEVNCEPGSATVSEYYCLDGDCRIKSCAGESVNADMDDTNGCECTPNAATGGVEACAVETSSLSVDDDCDGQTDEDATPEICDGLDNDCDGLTDLDDPDLTVADAPAHICVSDCPDNHTAVCNGAAGWDCSYESWIELSGDVPVQNETWCDGLDNDCDGLTDEGPGITGAEGLGTVCANDTSVLGVCYQEGILACDTDKTLSPVCCSADEVVCASGAVSDPASLQTDTDEADPDTADGLDNDCDGLTDEGITSCVASSTLVEYNVASVDYAFEIFSYEASRLNATPTGSGDMNAVPCSRSGVLPWTNVSGNEAAAACQMLNEDANPAGPWQVCTAEQWELACEMGSATQTLYPYSDIYEPLTCNGADLAESDVIEGTGDLAGCYSDYSATLTSNLFDMSGNVEEWTSSPSPADPGLYQIRGGSYNDQSGGLTCTYDFWASEPDDFRMDNLGFRCCKGDDPGALSCTPADCDTPPDNLCDGNTLYIYEESGKCRLGVCEYAFEEVKCPAACLSQVGDDECDTKEDWHGYLTVDNQFDMYFGTPTQTTGILVMHGNNWQLEYEFTALDRERTDYMYVVTASDQSCAQGLIGVFENTTIGKSTKTGDPVWEVFPAGKYSNEIVAACPAAVVGAWPGTWPTVWPTAGLPLPNQAQVDCTIAWAEANDAWVTPVGATGYDNDFSTAHPGYSNDWISIKGSVYPHFPPNAQWIWHNKGNDTNLSGCSWPVPLQQHNHDEFLIFRVAGAIPDVM